MATNDDFDFMGETKLMGYGESDSSGAWIKLQVLPEDLEVFRGLKGEVFETALRNVDKGPLSQPEPKGEHGSFARDLVLSGFFNSGRVRGYFGGDKRFLEWLKGQSCAITGEMDTDPDTGERCCDPAHVRRADEAGTGYKPKYSAIPLLHEIHRLQHEKGEIACLIEYGVIPGAPPLRGSDGMAREWFEKKAKEYVRNWLIDELRTSTNHTSLTELAPGEFFTWCRQRDLQDEIPQKLREKYT